MTVGQVAPWPVHPEAGEDELDELDELVVDVVVVVGDIELETTVTVID